MDREKHKKIVVEIFDGIKTTRDIANIIFKITGERVSWRTVERYETELRSEGKITTRFEHRFNTTENKSNIKNYNEILAVLKSELKKTEPYPITITNTSKKGDTLNILISDWHIGKLIKDEYGNIVYNADKAKKQIEKFIQETLTLLDKYISKGTPINDVVILSAGDILDGLGIFSTQETLSEFAPPFQVLEAAQLVQKLILSLTKRNLNVRFYGVKGNHGEVRIHGKAQDPNAHWDLMLYIMLDFWVKTSNLKHKIQINYSELDYINFNNRSWTYHLRHIAPGQSETAGGKAKFLGWVKKHNCQVLAYGHLHHYGIWDRSGITVIRGGALTAGDEFAEMLAEESEPIQVIWGCNEKRPVTFIYPVDLGIREKQ